MSRALSDAVMVFHATFVTFVVGCIVATWVGLAMGSRRRRAGWGCPP